MPNRKLFAWIDIYLDKSVLVKTVKEPTDSFDAAYEQFEKLNDLFNSWVNPNQGILLDTENGYSRFSARVISNSLLILRVEELEDDGSE